MVTEAVDSCLQASVQLVSAERRSLSCLKASAATRYSMGSLIPEP
jgi:hypothetical protein